MSRRLHITKQNERRDEWTTASDGERDCSLTRSAVTSWMPVVQKQVGTVNDKQELAKGEVSLISSTCSGRQASNLKPCARSREVFIPSLDRPVGAAQATRAAVPSHGLTRTFRPSGFQALDTENTKLGGRADCIVATFHRGNAADAIFSGPYSLKEENSAATP